MARPDGTPKQSQPSPRPDVSPCIFIALLCMFKSFRCANLSICPQYDQTIVDFRFSLHVIFNNALKWSPLRIFPKKVFSFLVFPFLLHSARWNLFYRTQRHMSNYAIALFSLFNAKCVCGVHGTSSFTAKTKEAFLQFHYALYRFPNQSCEYRIKGQLLFV